MRGWPSDSDDRPRTHMSLLRVSLVVKVFSLSLFVQRFVMGQLERRKLSTEPTSVPRSSLKHPIPVAQASDPGSGASRLKKNVACALPTTLGMLQLLFYSYRIMNVQNPGECVAKSDEPSDTIVCHPHMTAHCYPRFLITQWEPLSRSSVMPAPNVLLLASFKRVERERERDPRSANLARTELHFVPGSAASDHTINERPHWFVDVPSPWAECSRGTDPPGTSHDNDTTSRRTPTRPHRQGRIQPI